ncbi:MAG: SPOR domain-containing protein [Methylotenera sp.]
MSKDYKQSSERQTRTKKGSPFLTGLLIGVLLGIGASLAVVVYLKGDESPFAMQANKEATTSLSEKIANDAKTQPNPAVVDNNNAISMNNTSPAEANDNKDETRFDFYTILPNNENKVSKEEEANLKATDKLPAAKKTYFLQVGSFHTEEEADNLKAKLALQGFEAVVQTAEIPDKGVWHRVRVGPLTDLDQISKTKVDLVSNGFNADLIKVNTENQ